MDDGCNESVCVYMCRGWMDVWMDGRVDGWIDDGWMDGLMDGLISFKTSQISSWKVRFNTFLYLAFFLN